MGSFMELGWSPTGIYFRISRITLVLAVAGVLLGELGKYLEREQLLRPLLARYLEPWELCPPPTCSEPTLCFGPGGVVGWLFF